MKVILKYFILIACVSKAGIAFAQQSKIDSLQNKISTSKEDSVKIKSLIALSFVYRDSNPVKSLEILNEATSLSKKNGEQKWIQLCILSKGQYFLFASNYDSCIYYSKSTIRDSAITRFTKHFGAAYNNLGSAYFRRGDYAKALAYYLKSIEAYENAGFKSSCIMPFSNVGLVYIEQKLFAEALQVYRKTIEVSLLSNESKGLTRAYNNTALIFARLNKIDSAIFYYKKSIEISEKTNDNGMLAQALNNIGAEYRTQNKYTVASEYLERSLKLRILMGDEQGQAQSLINIGINFQRQGDYKKALTYLNEALIISKKIAIKNEISEVYKSLSEIEELQHNYKESLKYFQLHKMYNDTMFNEHEFEKIAQLNSQNAMAKKDHEIELQESEISKQKAETAKQNTQRNAFIIGFILFFALALIAFRGYKRKQKDDAIIISQKQEVEEAKALVDTKQKEVLDSIRYAKRIQNALITSELYIQKSLNKLMKD